MRRLNTSTEFHLELASIMITSLIIRSIKDMIGKSVFPQPSIWVFVCFWVYIEATRKKGLDDNVLRKIRKNIFEVVVDFLLLLPVIWLSVRFESMKEVPYALLLCFLDRLLFAEDQKKYKIRNALADTGIAVAVGVADNAMNADGKLDIGLNMGKAVLDSMDEKEQGHLRRMMLGLAESIYLFTAEPVISETAIMGSAIEIRPARVSNPEEMVPILKHHQKKR